MVKTKNIGMAVLGAAAVAGLMSVSTAQAMPIGKLHLSDGVTKAMWPADADLHAYPAGPGWLGKGVGAPGYDRPPHATHHRHHR